MKSFAIAALAVSGIVGTALAGDYNPKPCGSGKKQWWGWRPDVSDKYCCENCQPGATFNPNVCNAETYCLPYPIEAAQCKDTWHFPKCDYGYHFICRKDEPNADECFKHVDSIKYCQGPAVYNEYLNKCVLIEKPCDYLGNGWEYNSKDCNCVRSQSPNCAAQNYEGSPSISYSLINGQCVETGTRTTGPCPPDWTYNPYKKVCQQTDDEVCDEEEGFSFNKVLDKCVKVTQQQPVEKCPSGAVEFCGQCFLTKPAKCGYNSQRKGCICDGDCGKCWKACPTDKPCQHNNAANGDCTCFAEQAGYCPAGTTHVSKISESEIRCTMCTHPKY